MYRFFAGILNVLLVSLQKLVIGVFAPQLLHKRLRESPENTPLAKPHLHSKTSNPALVVTNDLISNANKMAAQVEPLIPQAKE